MKSAVISPALSRAQDGIGTSFFRRKRRWSALLLLSAIGGIMTGITGLVLAGAALLHLISPFGGLSMIGTFLLVVTFPILIFQAHCLDAIEAANRDQRVASYRRMVFGEVGAEEIDGN